MNAIIQQFQKELTAAERHAFEARAALAGRLPGAHLKSLLFSDQASSGTAGPARNRKPKSKSQPAPVKALSLSASPSGGEGKRRRTLRK